MDQAISGSQASADRAPRHILVVGVVSLLWNAMGAMDYTMTKLGSQAWLKSAPPEMLKAIAAYPTWATAAWAVGVWGSLLGSILLIARSRHGAAGEARSLEFSWDTINQAVADTYLRLIRQKAFGKRK